MVVKRRYSPASTLWISCILAVAGAALLGEQAASQQQPSKLLFLTHAGLYKHTSLGPAEMAVASWGEEAGYEVTSVQGYLQEQEELDLSVITAEYLARTARNLAPAVYPVPRDIDDEVGKLKLRSMGIDIDSLTDEQQRYLESWDMGT